MAAKFKKDFLFKFAGDTKDLERAVSRAERSLGGMDKKVTGSDRAMTGLKKTAFKLGAALSVGLVARGITSAISRAEEMNSVYAVTDRIIKQTGESAGVTGIQVQNMAREMAGVTGLDKSIATEAVNVLLTFKELKNTVGEGNDVLSRAHDLTADMATVFGGAATDAAKTLGKALNAPIEGLSALRRVGVTFTEQQKTQIRTLVESGDVLSAQKIILEELESQVGGTAAASADASELMVRSFQEITEEIGQELLPMLESITPTVVAVAGGVAHQVSGMGLGVQSIGRVAKMMNEAITLGMIDAWTEADQALFSYSQTQRFANDLLKDGSDAAEVAAGWMISLASANQLTAENVKRVQKATGLTNEKMADARDIAKDQAKALGLTSDQLEILLGLTKEYAAELDRTAVQAEEDFAEAARDAAGELMEQVRATEKADLALREFIKNTEDVEKLSDSFRGLTAEQIASLDIFEVLKLKAADALQKLRDEWGSAEGRVRAYIQAVKDAAHLDAFFAGAPTGIVQPGGSGSNLVAHGGGIVGGTKDVLVKLEGGEGVIDKRTMNEGAVAGGDNIYHLNVYGSQDPAGDGERILLAAQLIGVI